MPRKPLKRRTYVLSVILLVLILISILVYLYARTYAKAFALGMDTIPKNVLISIASRAGLTLVMMIVAAVLIAVVSLVFQTTTQTHILTPSIIGFDALFVLSQTLFVYLFTEGGLLPVAFLSKGSIGNFILSTVLMMGVVLMMYRLILRKQKNNIMFLLLLGLIISSVVRSFTSYVQILLDPEQLIQVQSAIQVTLTNPNSLILYMTLPVLITVIIIFYNQTRPLDVMSLGEVEAKNLGIDYERKLYFYMVLIAISMSAATALIGPFSFLGLLAVNIARQLTKTHRHKVLLWISSLVSILFLVAGQALVELLGYPAPVTVIIQFVGGIYMLYLLMRRKLT